MKSFAFDNWDNNHLIVNREWADLFQAHHLDTFDAWMNYQDGVVAKNLLKERTTVRVELTDSDQQTHAFYLKRHQRPPLKEYIKPLMRLTKPIIGARSEWDAMIRFHALSIPTMVPAAFGERGGRSFVLSAAIDGCTKLSHWVENQDSAEADNNQADFQPVIDDIAKIARTMHDANMHHQDFYLTHLLLPESENDKTVRVIDLGRVQQHAQLAHRWIVKDLAQLNYSAHGVSNRDRWRFLRAYLQRPIRPSDKKLVQSVLKKSNAIARHSHKNSL